MISDIKNMYRYDLNYPHEAIHDYTGKDFVSTTQLYNNGDVGVFPMLLPVFRVKELMNHDGTIASVQLEVKYMTYKHSNSQLVDQTDWIKVPRVKDTNGL